MEERILIKSIANKKVKSILLGIGLVFAIPGLLIALIFLGQITGYDEALVKFIIGCSCLLIGIVFLIIYWGFSMCELSITENNVKGKTLFGKEVTLPLYMVSAYSTRKFFSTIAVATSSGVTKFSLIENYAEIGNVLSQKINERQERTTNEQKPSASSNSSMDDLVKLKGLLDAGIITQEEFDAKKKQLLGL